MFKAVGTNIIVKPDTDFWKKRFPWENKETGAPAVYELESGIVATVGRGSFTNGSYEPMEVEAGQRVFFEPYDPKSVTYKGEVYVILQVYDIVGVEDGEEQL